MEIQHPAMLIVVALSLLVLLVLYVMRRQDKKYEAKIDERIDIGRFLSRCRENPSDIHSLEIRYYKFDEVLKMAEKREVHLQEERRGNKLIVHYDPLSSY